MSIYKKIWLHIFKAYLSLGLFFYFKRINVFHAANLPKNESVLILCNHQNALLDALLLATKSGRFVHFLTRASVFKKSWVDSFLRSLQMLPVYRIRDGWSNLPKNNSIFTTCSKLLSKNEAVVIFPEGSHNLIRSVRPLSKGFTRIVFETLQQHPDTDLKLLPVGLNFVNAKESKDSAAIYFGELIDAKNYLTDFKNDNIVELKRDIYSAITKLTTHIPLEKYDEILEKLEKRHVDFLNPIEANSCIQSDFEACEYRSKKTENWLQKGLMVLLKLVLFPAFLLWKYYLQPKIKELEFTSTFRFAISVTLVPIWLLVIGVALSIMYAWYIGLAFISAVLLLALLAIKF